MSRKRPTISFDKPNKVSPKRELDQMFTESAERLRFLTLPIEQIEPDPDQPRRSFNDDSLQSLAKSIQESGVIQPIEVIQTGRNQYRIVHGERRWRASKLAKQQTIPALVKRSDYDDTTRYVRQLVENMQREDLNDIDRAAGLINLRELMQDQATAAGATRKVSFAKVAERVGFTRQRVSQLVKLLDLPQPLQLAVREGRISERDTRLFQPLTPNQQANLFHAWDVDQRLSQNELKKVAALLKKNSSMSVERAIINVQVGQAKVEKSAEQKQRERNERGALQLLKGLQQIDVDGLNSAEAHTLLQSLAEAEVTLSDLIGKLKQRIS